MATLFLFQPAACKACQVLLLIKATGSIYSCLLGLPQIIFDLHIFRSKIKPAVRILPTIQAQFASGMFPCRHCNGSCHDQCQTSSVQPESSRGGLSRQRRRQPLVDATRATKAGKVLYEESQPIVFGYHYHGLHPVSHGAQRPQETAGVAKSEEVQRGGSQVTNIAVVKVSFLLKE